MELGNENISNFGEYLRVRGRQSATIESYSRDARGFLAYTEASGVSPKDIEPQTLIDYQAHLKVASHGKENSIRRNMIGIRQFFRFLADDNVISSSPLDDVPIPGRDETLPKTLSSQDVDELLDQNMITTPILKGYRDAAIVSLIGFEGLKAGEIISLTWTDFLKEKKNGSLKIRGTRSRVIKLHDQTTEKILKYRAEHKKISLPLTKDGEQHRMFISFKGREAAIPVPNITRHGIKFMLSELGQKIDIRNLNTEQLRHHATTFLLEEGKSPDEIMAHFGLRRIGNIAKHISSNRRALAEKPPPMTPATANTRQDRVPDSV